MAVEHGSQLPCFSPPGGRRILLNLELARLVYFLPSSVRRFPKAIRSDRGTKFDNDVLRGLNRLV